jgi:phage/plasmid-associated DNA primase
VILSGNNEPIIKDNTNGAWRRLKKIPFTVTIPNQIDGFEDTFNDELPGILNWLIEGCLLRQKEGLKDPLEVIDATEEYRKDQDYTSQFLDDCCIRNPEAEETKKTFKAAYLNWCTESSLKAMGDKELKQRLSVFNIKDGFNSSKTNRVWKGVRLKILSDTTDSSGQENPKPSHEGENCKNSMESSVRSCPSEANPGQENEKMDGKSVNIAGDESDDSDGISQELPDCKKCGRCEWVPDEKGQFACSCGYVLEANNV